MQDYFSELIKSEKFLFGNLSFPPENVIPFVY